MTIVSTIVQRVKAAMTALTSPTPATIAEVLAIARPQIQREESCRLSAYLDSRGIQTIGWGHTKGVRLGMVCSQSQADTWLEDDMTSVCIELNFKLPWWLKIGAARAAVLLEMGFQLGVGISGVSGLLDFQNMLASCEAGDFAAAARNALDSKWAKQTPERAEREAEQLRTGTVV